MKWKEARELFPNQFLLVSILDYHYEGEKKIIDEVALVRPIKDKDANKEFFNAKEGTMVYHTKNEEFVIHIRKDALMKVRRV
jgi:phage/plasmid-associated DNA primase